MKSYISKEINAKTEKNKKCKEAPDLMKEDVATKIVNGEKLATSALNLIAEGEQKEE